MTHCRVGDTIAPPDFAAKAQEYMDARVRASDFSGAVLVAEDGRPAFRAAYGMASHQLGVPNAPELKFRVGSVTKQFTAAAVLMLEQRGQLDVSAPVERYLPDWPPAWKGITIHHLLSHTAGLPRLTIAQPLPDVSGLSRTAPLAIPASILDLAKPEEKLQAPDFVPGEGWAYSNIGYAVLGELIERVSGKPYRDFMHDEVFAPLGMSDTGVEEPARVEGRLASGYARVEGRLVNAGYVDLRFIRSTGAVFSTVDDLLVWDRALGSDRLLSERERAKLFSPVRSDYAYGWWVQKRLGRDAQWHRGNVQGFVSVILRFPESGLFVAVLSNVERTEVLAVAIELAAIALGEPYDLPHKHVASPGDLGAFDALVGSYRGEDNPEDVWELRRDGDRLLIVWGTVSFEVVPESPKAVFARGLEWGAVFQTDAEGDVHVQRRKDGEIMRYVRVR